MYKNAGTLAILVWALLLYTIRVRSLDFFPQSLFLVYCTWHTSSSHATRIAFFRTYQQKWPCTILCRIKIYIRFTFVHNWLMGRLRLFQITISKNQPGYQTGICNYIPYILAFFTITLSPFSNCSLETPLNPSPTCSVLYPQPFDFRSFVCISMVVIIVSNTPPFVL